MDAQGKCFAQRDSYSLFAIVCRKQLQQLKRNRVWLEVGAGTEKAGS
jgi:hypothetical protein